MKKALYLMLALTLMTLAIAGCGNGILPDTTETTDITAPDYYPTAGWLYTDPAEQQMDADILAQLRPAFDDLRYAVNCIVVTRNGYIVHEDYRTIRYNADTLNPVYSVTKSILTALIGIAIQDGDIPGLNARVIDFYTDRNIQNMDERKQNITVEDLLKMKGGLQWNEWALPYTDPNNIWIRALNSGDAIQFVLDQPMATEPGTTWNYCGGYSYLLADILEKVTGKDVFTYAREKLFAPLGITNVDWRKDSGGLYESAGGLQLTAPDMAKFGQLILYEGRWEGKQIIPADFIEAALTAYHRTSRTTEYGYQSWWIAEEGYFYCDGINGQRIYVIPEHNIVVAYASTVASPNDAQIRATVTNYIVGACTDINDSDE